MKFIPILFLLLTITTHSFSQEIISKTFYKDQYGNKKVTSKKAKFYEVITAIDESNVTHEMFRTKDNKLFRYKRYKNKMPFGVWKYYNKKSNSYTEDDYNIEVIYSGNKEVDGIYFDYSKGVAISTLEADANFVAPKLIGFDNPFHCLYREIKYPSYARENGIMGTVLVQLKIGKDGQLTLLSIYKGLEPHMDFESMRALNVCNEWTPATLNGEAIDAYSIVEVKFRLE